MGAGVRKCGWALAQGLTAPTSTGREGVGRRHTPAVAHVVVWIGISSGPVLRTAIVLAWPRGASEVWKERRKPSSL